MTTTRFRADQVGSLLRPQALLDARAAHAAGQLDADGLRAAEDEAIIAVIAMQEAAGIDVVTDGDFRRQSFMTDFPDSVEGFVAKEVETTWHGRGGATSDRRVGNIVVGGKLRQHRRLTADQAAFVQQHATRPFKITLPSPALFIGDSYQPGVTDAFYPDRSSLLADLTEIVRGEVDALAADGVPYIQLDNPRYGRLVDEHAREDLLAEGIDPERELDEMIASDNRCVETCDREGRAIAIHLCRGNSRSRWMHEGSYEPVAEKIFNALNFDALLLEYDDERSGGFEPLRFVPAGKLVVLGLVTSKVPELEDGDVLVRRIEEAAKFIPIEQLALSPQCGFASVASGNLLSHDDERRKLELVAETAARVWGAA
jgi:5-methyltetrahydropteroyltriglutamate--homocysteine methyltransferase